MSDDYEVAEEFNNTRARMAPFIGFFILALQQGVVFAWEWGPGSLLQSLIWLAFAMVMLALLLTGGGWFLSPAARALADDEPTRANRDRAVRMGFIAAIITCFLVVAVAPFEPLPAQRAAHIIASVGLGCAFLAFGVAEISANG